MFRHIFTLKRALRINFKNGKDKSYEVALQAKLKYICPLERIKYFSKLYIADIHLQRTLKLYLEAKILKFTIRF